MLIILICIAGSGIWQAREHGVRFMRGGLDFWGQQYDYPVSATASAGGMKRIVFENPRGSIKVTGGDSKDVTVTGRKLIRAYRAKMPTAPTAETPVEIVPQGDRLVVRTNQDRVPRQPAHLRRPGSHRAARHGAWNRAAPPATTRSTTSMATSRSPAAAATCGSRASAATSAWT